jgi:hypothetical protein
LAKGIQKHFLWGIAAMSKETTVFFTKEEILALLNHAFTTGLFSYKDLCEEKALGILNEALKNKIGTNEEELKIGVKVANAPVESSAIYNWNHYDYFSNSIFTTFTS